MLSHLEKTKIYSRHFEQSRQSGWASTAMAVLRFVGSIFFCLIKLFLLPSCFHLVTIETSVLSVQAAFRI